MCEGILLRTRTFSGVQATLFAGRPSSTGRKLAWARYISSIGVCLRLWITSEAVEPAGTRVSVIVGWAI